MYAGTFTASMKIQTSNPPICKTNKGTFKKTQVPHDLYSSSPESCLTFLNLLLMLCYIDTTHPHPLHKKFKR